MVDGRLIQRRQDGSVDFYRDWEEYKIGFGNKVGEYWLGLDNIYYLTSHNSSLYIYLETFEEDDLIPHSAFAEYSSFRINGESDKYRLTYQEFNGSCGDSLSYYSNNSPFTTRDNDNDNHHGNCAEKYTGAWWYGACHHTNLNGLYKYGRHTEFAEGITWKTCWGQYYSLKKCIMKIRRFH